MEGKIEDIEFLFSSPQVIKESNPYYIGKRIKRKRIEKLKIDETFKNFCLDHDWILFDTGIMKQPIALTSDINEAYFVEPVVREKGLQKLPCKKRIEETIERGYN